MGIFDIAAGVATGGAYTVGKAALGALSKNSGQSGGPDTAERDRLERERRAAMEQRRAGLRSEYDKISAAPGPTALTAEATPAGPLPQFDIMRNRVQQRSRAEGQSQQDTMQRRLAAAGVLNSGAGIKAIQNTQESNARATEDAVSGVDAQEAQQRTQLEESVKGRNLQRDTFNEDQRFKDKMFRVDTFAKFQDMETRLDTMDLSALQMKLQEEESGFNRRLAMWQAQSTGGLFGGGGALGLGLDTPGFGG